MSEKPQWIPIATMTPEGSLGAYLINRTQDLGVRLRPETTFNQSIKRSPSNKHLTQELSDAGILTMGDLLRMPENRIIALTTNPGRLVDSVRGYLEGLLITPHGRVIEAIFGKKQIPVPAEFETELILGLEQAISSVMPLEPRSPIISYHAKDIQVIQLRFGLMNGIPHSLEETSGYLEVSKDMISLRQNRTLRILRHPSRSNKLRGFFGVPAQSFGKQVFGAFLARDFPDLRRESIDSLQLPPEVKEELASKVNLRADFSVEDLVLLDLSKSKGLEKATVDNVASALLRKADEVANRLRLQAEEIAQTKIWAEQERLARMEGLKNNLIPQIDLTRQQLEEIGTINIHDLGSSNHLLNALVRSNLNIVGDILNLSLFELSNIRNVGVGTLDELGVILGNLFGLDEDQTNTIRRYLALK